jgi:hypothetical protein
MIPPCIYTVIEAALAAPDPQDAWHRATMWALKAVSEARRRRGRLTSQWERLSAQIEGAEAAWLLDNAPDVAECLRGAA